MKRTHRFLTAILIAIVVSFCYGTTAYAAKLTAAEPQSGIEAWSITDAASAITSGEATADITDNTSDSATDSTTTDTAVDAANMADTTDTDTQDQVDDTQADTDTDIPVTADGSDASADASEDSPIDETVIEDIPEDTSSDDVSEVATGSKDNKKDNAKAKPVAEKPSYSEKDLRLLACLVYTEAGNQSYEGMLAVANVVLNRVKSNVYWHVNTIEEVIYDNKWAIQFAVTKKDKKTGLSAMDKALKCYDTGKFTGANPQAQKKAMNRAIKAAKDALCGKNNIGSFLCFCNKSSVKSIKKKYSDYKIIGDHIFYRSK